MGRGGEALVSGIGSGGALGGVKGAVRVRNKITHKTRLRILHGDVADADRTILDDLDAQDGKALATGVDAEDANVSQLAAERFAGPLVHVGPPHWPGVYSGVPGYLRHLFPHST